MRKRRSIRLALLLFFLTVLVSGCGKKEEGGLYDFSGQDPQVIDPWVYLKDTSISDDQTLLGFASSASELGMTIGIIGMVFSILYMAIRIACTHNSKKKEEIKQEAIWKGGIAILFFSIPFWLGLMKAMGDLFIQ